MFGKKKTQATVSEDDLVVPDVVELDTIMLTPCDILIDDFFEPTFVKVVGESFQQEVLEQIGRLTKSKTFEIWLMPEPRNRHDRNAVKVMAGRHQIGYLAKDQAKIWSKRVNQLWANGLFLHGEAWGVDDDPKGKGKRVVWGAKIFDEPSPKDSKKPKRKDGAG